MKAAYGELFKSLEIVNADLLDAETINNAINGATYVVHTASPVTNDVDKYEETAVNGTLNVLKACHSNHVKKCIITGSVDTVVYVKDEDKVPEG